ncbi:MAG TPA: YceI family protein [Candidatus Aquilonibacter sp.]|nr:YceI family protein [Candidatus Aquilonibacter sp.]
MSTVGATQAMTVRYLIDAKGSTFTVKATATGMLSVFGHNPTIAIPDFDGEARFASSTLEHASLRLTIQAASLVVTDDISNKDRAEIERRMHDEVLEADGFPEIIYECPGDCPVQKLGEGLYSASLNGELTMHGVTRSQPLSARVTLKEDSLRASGEFAVRLSDYEIRPVSAAGGTVKLKNEIKLSFNISARQQM